MLRSIDGIRGYALKASDGDIGHCDDFIFDDSTWTVRYMVAETGSWLTKRKVLISPLALDEPDWGSGRFAVKLSKAQIEDSPPLERDAPVSHEYEREWTAYHNWSPYWVGGELWGDGRLPQRLAERAAPGGHKTILEKPSHNLRSMKEVAGYHIQANDGAIGHIEDFIVDDDSWSIMYLVVDIHNWLPGRKVLVPPTWAESVHWNDRTVHLDLSRDQVKDAPEYRPGEAVNRRYEERLYDYYGRPSYWGR